MAMIRWKAAQAPTNWTATMEILSLMMATLLVTNPQDNDSNRNFEMNTLSYAGSDAGCHGAPGVMPVFPVATPKAIPL